MTEHQSLAPEPELSERLQLYARYVGIVAEQLEALAAERTGRIAELEEERLATEARLREGQDGSDDGRGPGLEGFLDLGLAALAENSDAARELDQRLSAISDGALRSARSIGRMRVRGGSYPELRTFEAGTLDRTL